MVFRILFKINGVKPIAGDMLSRGMATLGSKKVGFIGLGNMGNHMASNLMKKGHKVTVFDIAPAAVKAMESKGAQGAKSSADVAKDADFVVTMLPNNDIVHETYKGIVKAGVDSKTMFIDSSTIDPSVVQSVQQLIKANGASFVDAPVSGGVPGAEAATLTFMVGGTNEEYNNVKEFLGGMGKNIVYCGGYGMGQAAKICNNMMLGISMIGVAEVMNLAIRLGLDPKTFHDIINSSTGRCWSSEAYSPVPGLVPTSPANRDYAGGFSTGLITKDLGIASNVAVQSNTPIPLGAMAHNIYRTLCAKGLANKDFAVIYDFLKNEKN